MSYKPMPGQLGYHTRARVALLESPAVPFKVVGMFEYLLCFQGNNRHAFPSLEQMERRVGSAKTLLSLIKDLEHYLGEVVSVDRGTGRRRTSYRLTPYRDFPLELVERLEAAESQWPSRSTGKTPVHSTGEIPVQAPVVLEKLKDYMVIIDGNSNNGEFLIDSSNTKRCDAPDCGLEITGQFFRQGDRFYCNRPSCSSFYHEVAAAF